MFVSLVLQRNFKTANLYLVGFYMLSTRSGGKGKERETETETSAAAEDNDAGSSTKDTDFEVPPDPTKEIIAGNHVRHQVALPLSFTSTYVPLSEHVPATTPARTYPFTLDPFQKLSIHAI